MLSQHLLFDSKNYKIKPLKEKKDDDHQASEGEEQKD
jgi:hypothetical protein